MKQMQIVLITDTNQMVSKAPLRSSLAKHDMPLANSLDPDQLATEEANWSGSALFVIKYVNIYKKKTGSSNLIGWKIEVCVEF